MKFNKVLKKIRNDKNLTQEEFAKLMSECGKSVEDGREKIIKKLGDNVYIEKED